MTLFGLTITRTKAISQQLSGVDNRGGWWSILRESFTGAWQRNIEVDTTTILSFSALYACITLIANDVAKLRIKLVKSDNEGIWTETKNPAYSPVLREPNHFQTRIQFIQNWVASKLIHGNAYILKQRDQRGVVVGLYVLDPTRCRPLVAPDGSVYYELKVDDLAFEAMRLLPLDGSDSVVVPASEIIHDRMVPLFHPLVGVSPIRACGLAALQGLKIQENSTQFFSNGSKPGGVLTAPNFIKDETAKRLKEYWDENFTGANMGKVAVLGDGLKYEQMAVNAHDAELVEQLRWTAENVCTAFHVPPYMIGIGPMPTYNNIEALNAQYYAQCLQIHLEEIESLLDKGLSLSKDGSPQDLGTEFELDDLLRMDTSTKTKAAADLIGSGAVSPNEARQKYFGLGGVTGGDTPYLQMQNYSLEALSKRDAQTDPFGTTPATAPVALPAAATSESDNDAAERAAEMVREEVQAVRSDITASREEQLTVMSAVNERLAQLEARVLPFIDRMETPPPVEELVDVERELPDLLRKALAA